MNAKIRNRMAMVAMVGAAATFAVGSPAQAEPPVYYAHAYQTQPAYINYGTPYVSRSTTVTYAQPTYAPAYVQPGYRETVVVQPAVTVVRPVYTRTYIAPRPVYYGPPVRHYYRPHYVARPYHRSYVAPYYGGHYYGGHRHRSWGFGVGGGRHGGGFSFHYGR